MRIAIIAGIITVVVVIAIALIWAYVHRSSKKPTAVAPGKRIVSIDTYGVNPPKTHTGFGVSGHTQVADHHTTSGNIGERLQSRFVAMGILAAAIFGSIIAKLWSMQVMQGARYQSKAQENLYTTVYTPAPRGVIYDATGQALVKNKSMFTILARSDVAENYEVMARLSALLGIPVGVIRQKILNSASGAQSNRVVWEDASRRAVAFLSEHADAFEGITCETRTTRAYPFGALAAHVLGYVGTVSDEELKSVRDGRTIKSGDVVGKAGIEASYDDLLAGDHGSRQLLTDADGNIIHVESETQPLRGNDVYLSIVGRVQQVADTKLREILAPNGVLGAGHGTAASVVCLDCTNGEIVALANFPTFAPESFLGGISQDVWDEFNTESSHYPLMNRAIAGAYPAASTFKAFTSMAAFSHGVATSQSSYTCTGTWTGFGEDYPQNCWNLNGHGTLDVVHGIAHSCDVVFYEIAKSFFERGDALGETAMQDYIKQFGFGGVTGIDIAGEVEGRIPTPQWKKQYFKDAPEEALWQGGDMTNMSIGQGYVLVTPLQIACGYAAIATGKSFVPHILKEVRNSAGEVVKTVEPKDFCNPDMKDGDISLVREGLKLVMDINNYNRFFEGVDYTVAGKTGTAEVAGKDDYSWFACYAPADDPKYVAVCVVEEGISSTESSIPVASEVLKAAMEYYNNPDSAANLGRIESAYSVTEYSAHNSARTD